MTRGSSSSLENIHLNSSDHHHHHHANRYALRAKNLIKTYKTGDIFNSTKLYVLNNLEINVRKGHIYGLLGPSGCGKTTLLKCLLGLVEIDSGEIHIHDELKCQKEKNQFRVDLLKLGFMPQDACLYFELTIKETFYYFGKLYKLDDKEIKRRAEFLVDLLDLPTTDRLACYLSGGQLRRTSLAVTLFNQPSMLVLDEPTVGMDPVLRKKIWNYLIELARKQRTTIIITTHYIEEARKAECLGFMRHGRIIEENSPEHFIHKYKHHILEDVFYAICIKDPDNAESDDDDHFTTAVVSHVPLKSVRESTTFLSKSPRKLSEISEEDNAENRTPKPSQSESQKQQEMTFGLFTIISLSRIIANIYKDLIKCKRNKKLMVVQLIVPLIQITLFCTCIGRPPLDIPVGFVDNEPSGQFVRLGRQFIDEIDNTTITKKFFTKFDDGMVELRKGNIWCLIEIDRNFTREMAQSYIKKKFVGGFDNSIHVYCDNTNHQISYAIRDSLLRAIKDLVERYFLKFQSKNTDEDINFEPEAEYSNRTDFDISYIDEDIHNLTSFHSDTKKSNKYPIVFEESVFGENEPVFTNFMAPGISLSVIFFMSVAATASNFVLERQLGLIERSYLIGVKTIEILISQLIVYSLIMLLQIAIIFCLLFGFFQLPLRGSLVLLVILTFSQGFCGLCYGLFLASVIFDQETAIQATLASFYPFLLMSGIIWPIEAQPVWLKSISSYLPLTYASESFRAILEKNWDLSNYYVLRGFVATYLWTILFSICFLLMFSRKFK